MDRLLRGTKAELNNSDYSDDESSSSSIDDQFESQIISKQDFFLFEIFECERSYIDKPNILQKNIVFTALCTAISVSIGLIFFYFFKYFLQIEVESPFSLHIFSPKSYFDVFKHRYPVIANPFEYKLFANLKAIILTSFKEQIHK